MKIMIDLSSTAELSFLKKYQIIDTVVIGIENLSLTPVKKYNYNELESAIKKIASFNFKIALNIERLFTDEELLNAKRILNENLINKVDYFIYSDFGIKVILDNLGQSEKLIYRAPTYLTNYQDVNLYARKNKYVVISNQISSEELQKITSKLVNPGIIDIFGMEGIFYSKRPLLSDYYEIKNIEKDKYSTSLYLIEETRTERLPLIEDETGTHVFEYNHYYLLNELKDIKNIDYGYIHLNFISKSQQRAVVDAYERHLCDYDDQKFLSELLNEGINIYKGSYAHKSVLRKGEVK